MPSDLRVELVRGELIPMPPPPGGEHGSKIERLASRVSSFVFDNSLGECFAAETGFKIDVNPDTVRGPDWSFVRKERIEGRLNDKHVPVVPDVVLEVRSPHDSRRAFADRIAMWINAGVEIVWALYPSDKRLVVHRKHEVRPLGPEDTLTGEEVIPGFELDLRSLFGERNK
jgi:Uma2 family endonuclease